jgi:hypothetical protein
MDNYIGARVKLAIREDIIKGEDWTNCRLLDEVKQKFPGCSSEDVESLYLGELRERLETMPETELRSLWDRQCALSPEDRNIRLLALIKVKLA